MIVSTLTGEMGCYAMGFYEGASTSAFKAIFMGRGIT